MRKPQLVLVVALLLAGVSPSDGQEAPSPDRFTTDHYFELERVSDAQLSPDGARIVYAREQANRLEDKWEPALWIMNADGSSAQRISRH